MKTSSSEKSRELYHNKWISLMEIDGYVYSTETRSNGSNVSILIYDSTRLSTPVLGRYELCPAHFDGFELCSFTGGVENANPQKTAIHEIKEEAGYTAEEHELKYLGTCRPSKSADTVVHLFAWDAKGKMPSEILGDGSKGEIGAYTKWVTAQEAYSCKDPLMSVLCGRMEIKNAT